MLLNRFHKKQLTVNISLYLLSISLLHRGNFTVVSCPRQYNNINFSSKTQKDDNNALHMTCIGKTCCMPWTQFLLTPRPCTKNVPHSSGSSSNLLRYICHENLSLGIHALYKWMLLFFKHENKHFLVALFKHV